MVPRSQRTGAIGLTFLLLASVTASTQGAVLEGVSTISGPGLLAPPFLSPFVFTAVADDDPAAITVNSVAFIEAIAFDATDYVDVTFSASDSAGTTQYAMSMLLDNATSDTWLAYELQLGFQATSGFVPATDSNFDFDALDVTRAPGSLPLSSSFSSFTYSPDRILWYAGSYGPDTLALLTSDVRMDVPNSGALSGVAVDGGSFEVTLRITPHSLPIPEPGASLCLGLGLSWLLGRRRLQA